MWKALAVLFVCGCGIGGVDSPWGDRGAGGDDVAAGSGGGIGGAGGGACEQVSRPRPLRQVRIVDSRGLEPDTLVLAAAPEPQTLWLPSAAENVGAVVVVKEAAGVSRRVSVFTTGEDTFLDDGSNESETNEERSSRTFIAAADDAGEPCWFLLDAMKQ